MKVPDDGMIWDIGLALHAVHSSTMPPVLAADRLLPLERMHPTAPQLRLWQPRHMAKAGAS
jgi:hypothetical protein